MRNYAKKAIMLTIDKNAKMEEIRQRVYHKMKVPQEDQVLILNGQLIPNDEPWTLTRPNQHQRELHAG